MKTDIELVEKSFGTCCISSTFLDDFYAAFLKASPQIGKMFEKTDMARQKQLLRSGISHLIMHAKGKATSQTKLQALAKSHSRSQLNIRPQLYPLWVNALLEAVKKSDPNYAPEVERAWREILKQGISQITAGY